jgi:hypothetical protein
MSTASLFQENRDEVMTPILPANINGPGIGLDNVNNVNVGQQGQQIANDVIGVGVSLRDKEQTIPVEPPKKQSMLGEFFGGGAKMAGELLDRGKQAEEQAPVPQQQLAVNMPAPGFGAGGGGR